MTAPNDMGGPYEWEHRRDAGQWRVSAMRLGVWYSRGQYDIGAFSG